MSETLVRRLLWEVRVLRILVVALAIGGGGVIAQNRPLDTSPIVTRQLTVEGKDGGESLRLSADLRTTLELRDAEGRVRVRLGMGAKAPSLRVYDERGRSVEYFGPQFGVRPLTEE